MDTNGINLQELFGPGLREYAEISKYTTFKIGGLARYFIEATKSCDLIDIVIKSRQINLPYYLLGGGTNVLFGDSGFNGLVIKNNTRNFAICAMKGSLNKKTQEKSVFVKSESGVPFNQLVRYTVDAGLSGLEMHLGLPGTVGGAVYMNAKWMHPRGFTGDAVYQATILTPDNQIKIVPKAYFEFDYGKSILQTSGDILIDVTFELIQGDKKKLWDTANYSIDFRRKTQPQGVFCAGCIFKNISKTDAIIHSIPDGQTSAGYLIDQVGMKNQSEGDAYVSDVHANFIINRSKSKAADVIKLIQNIKAKVKKTFGVDLVEEVIRVGDF
jgi:UDP-N-acetylmuramate dehydrogenase